LEAARRNILILLARETAIANPS